jgi:GNAT superfamily N-acetyltransferase
MTEVPLMVRYQRNPMLDNRQLNELSAASWDAPGESDFGPVLKRSLGYIGAFDGDLLIAFVNIAWDGREHAFLLDTMVRPEFQRQGVGTELVTQAISLCREAGITWVHVDFEPHLSAFYLTACRFRPSAAGVMKLPDDGEKGGA